MLSPGTYERDADSRLRRRAGRGDVERGLVGEYVSDDDPEKDTKSHRRERPVSVSSTWRESWYFRGFKGQALIVVRICRPSDPCRSTQ
jgi:hypothetical protein